MKLPFAKRSQPTQSTYFVAQAQFAFFWVLVLAASTFPNCSGWAQESNLASPKQEAKKYPSVEEGISLFKKGHVSEAYSLFKKAKEKHPEISPPEVMLARLYYAAKKNALGKNSLQSAILKNPKDPEAWNILADIHLRQGNWIESQMLFAKAVDYSKSPAFPDSVRMKNQVRFAFDGLAKTYEARKQWDIALSTLQDWNTRTPAQVEVLRRIAMVQLNLNQVDQARQTLQNAKKLDPEVLHPGIAIGNYYQQKGDSTKAKSEIKNAVESNQDSFITQVAGARWAIAAGELEMAEVISTVLQEKNSESIVPKILLASIELFKGNAEKSESLFRSVNQSNPGNFEAVLGLAMSLLKQGDPVKLKQGMEHAQIIAKGNQDLRSYRGRQAVSVFAWALFKNGQLNQAEQIIQKLAQSGELGPDAAYFAAEIYNGLDRKELAGKLIDGALSSSKSFVHREDAQKLRKTLAK